jgi:ankyrin repeat protein
VALKRNDLTLAQAMLDAGTDVNQAAVNGVTPLMAAAYGGNAQMVATLIAKGADLNARDRLKKTAMVYAAGEGHTEIVHSFSRKASMRTRSTTTI